MHEIKLDLKRDSEGNYSTGDILLRKRKDGYFDVFGNGVKMNKSRVTLKFASERILESVVNTINNGAEVKDA